MQVYIFVDQLSKKFGKHLFHVSYTSLSFVQAMGNLPRRTSSISKKGRNFQPKNLFTGKSKLWDTTHTMEPDNTTKTQEMGPLRHSVIIPR